jgi:hypothetical protein
MNIQVITLRLEVLLKNMVQLLLLIGQDSKGKSIEGGQCPPYAKT